MNKVTYSFLIYLNVFLKLNSFVAMYDNVKTSVNLTSRLIGSSLYSPSVRLVRPFGNKSMDKKQCSLTIYTLQNKSMDQNTGKIHEKTNRKSQLKTFSNIIRIYTMYKRYLSE